jgi:hypothetical protein
MLMHCAVKPEFSPTYIHLNLAVKGKKQEQISQEEVLKQSTMYFMNHHTNQYKNQCHKSFNILNSEYWKRIYTKILKR